MTDESVPKSLFERMVEATSTAERLRAQGIEVETVGDIIENGSATIPPHDRADPPRQDAVPDVLPGIGDNNPPPPTPFEAIQQEILDLYDEAKNWCDGEPIQNEDQAEAIGKLRGLIIAAAKRAEELRVELVKPLDTAKKEIQDRFNPLIQKEKGKTELAKAACNKALAPYLKKKDDEQRAEAARLQVLADERAAEAAAAARVAAQTGNLEHMEKAEELIDAAKDTEKVAKLADKAKPQVAGLNKKIGMKSVFRAEMTNPGAALAHYRARNPGELKEWLREMARKDVAAGLHYPADAIPGFTIIEDRVPA